MELTDHVEGVKRALALRRKLDPALPRHPRTGVENLLRFRANPWALLNAAARRGPVVRVDMLYKPTIVVHHPHDLAAILEQPEVWLRGDGLVPLIGRNTLTTNGPEWLFNRQAIQPSFHPRMVDRASGAFAPAVAEAIEAWGGLAGPEPVDAAFHAVRLFARHATAAFGLEVTDAEADQLPDALLRLQRWAFRVVAGGAPRTDRVDADFGLLEGIVARSLATPPRPGEPPTLVERLRQDHAVDRATLRDHLLLALIAPADNPPNAFAFLLWLLARNPAHQEAARAEVRAVLGSGPLAGPLPDLPLVDRTIQEGLRLLPPVWWLARTAHADTVLRGHRIPAGTMAFLSIWLAHRHPEIWKDPEVFQPDRFLPEAVEARHRAAWLPFGAGPRMCIGTRLATQEIRLVLALFLRRLRALPAGPDALPLQGYFALRSKVGLPIRLERL